MKTMIAIPCMDTMPIEFVRSLVNLEPVGEICVQFISCSLVYKARNDLSELAVQRGADFVLWLDSDVQFPPSLLKDLMADIEGRDMVTGVCHMRRVPFLPCIFKTLRIGAKPDETQEKFYEQYPRDGIFEVEGCGFGAVLVRAKVIKDVLDKYHEAFGPLPGLGEDLSFCVRARGCGYTLHCDPKIQIGHRATTIVTDKTFEAYAKAGIREAAPC